MKKIILIYAIIFLSACSGSQGTSTGNPLVALQFKSFNALSADRIGSLTVSSLKMCFKRLRFKPVSGLDENIDITLEEMTIVAAGNLVTTASVPPGTYSRVEFDLDPHCASAKSVQVTNSNGAFANNQTITIRFDGMLVLSISRNLDLNFQAIIDALNTVTSDANIKTKAESIGGSY